MSDDDGPGCHDIAAWFKQFAISDGDEALAPAVSGHIHGCPACQARLFVRLEALIGAFRDSIDCERCEADIGSYVDAERRDIWQAIQWYPALRRHLRGCPACREYYELLSTTLDDPGIQALSVDIRRIALRRRRPS